MNFKLYRVMLGSRCPVFFESGFSEPISGFRAHSSDNLRCQISELKNSSESEISDS